MQNSFNQSTNNNSIITSDSPLFTTAIGILSLRNSSGVNNTAAGYQALQSMRTGTDNVAVGYYALKANFQGINNVAVGSESMKSNTTGNHNTAVGFSSLAENILGSNNTAIGSFSLEQHIGSSATGIGYQALQNNLGDFNTSVGYNALQTNTIGTDGVAFGYQALQANSSGSYNVAVGSEALRNNTLASNNTAVGYHSLLNNLTGSINTAVGDSALAANTTGSNNVAVGASALINCVSGSRNVVVGYNAGSAYVTSESNNICIGYSVTGSVNDGSVTRIGANIDRCFISGINGKISSSGVNVFCNPSGQLGTTTSSIRYKTDIRDITESDAIYKLRPICFRFKNIPDFQEFGLIAEEVNEIIPDIVIKNDENQPETIRYQFLPILMLKEMQALRNENIRFKKTVEEILLMLENYSKTVS
jgi:trimeric autotransporter adhesin